MHSRIVSLTVSQRQFLQGRIIVAFWAVLLAAVVQPANAKLLPDHPHWEAVTNSTGAVANDLHINVLHPISKFNNGADVASDTFSVVTGALHGLTLSWKGPATPPDTRPNSVANGGQAFSGWWSKFAADVIQDGNWTSNGADIGAFDFKDKSTSFNLRTNPDNSVTVSLANMGTEPVNYSNLVVRDQIPIAYFNLSTGPYNDHADFVDHMFDVGTVSVPLLVGSSGMLSPDSSIDVATFTPLLRNYFSAESVMVDGRSISTAQVAVPEPVSAILALVGSAWFLGAARRRKAC